MKKKKLFRLLIVGSLLCATTLGAYASVDNNDDDDGGSGGSCSPGWAVFGKTSCNYLDDNGVVRTITCKHFLGITTKCFQSNAVQS
ncbi:MAG: hypothetical protein JSR12_10860 [Bacteroidetes bacterium]|nr:hypothetical protein [Bacteroidota bacterium]MBS1643363.1 hypothetical protein [Bacteroidota bacterium]